MILTLLFLGCALEPDPEPAQAEAVTSPERTLASLDGRTPVPLIPRMAWHQKQSMMAHLEAIQGITLAQSKGDFDAVIAAVKPIESSPQMQAQCEHMGEGAPGFTELALAFHEAADRIRPAAEAQDQQAVLAATAETLAACTRCHETYRQEVVAP